MRNIKKLVNNQVKVVNYCFSDKLCVSVKERTCFQKDNYDSFSSFFILCSNNESQEPEPDFEEKGSSEDSTDSENGAFWDNLFRDLVFERVLACIINQVDSCIFQARFCGSDLIVTSYLRPELCSNLTKLVEGSLVRLEYNYSFGPRVYYIIQVINSQIKKGPWIWNTVYAEITGEEYQYEEEDDRILHARLLESGEVVRCKVFDHLRNTMIQKRDLVYLQVNEKNRSYFIIEIVHRYEEFLEQ